jgi:hypothetical protein
MRHNRSVAKEPLPAESEASPCAVLHAKALVISHGVGRARDIAQMNASLERDDPYWDSVLRAIGTIEKGFPRCGD